MRKVINVTFLIFVFALAASAQEKQAETKATPPTDSPLPTIDEILDKFVEALGGKAAMEKFSSRVVKGSFEIPAMGVAASSEISAKTPNKWILVIDIPGFGFVRQGYDGSAGWAEDPQSGLRDLAGAELAAMKRSAEFNQPLKLKELYPTITVKGKGKVGDREAYILEATPPEGSLEKMYFDTQTNLLIKADIEAESPQGKMPFEVTFEDYKEVDGVKLAHTMRRSSPAISFVMKIDEVKHDVPIEDDKFKKPSADKPAPEKKTP